MNNNFKKHKLNIALYSACVLMTAGFGIDSYAAVADLAVSATVSDNCTIATAPVGFGTYNPLSGTDLIGNGGSVTVTCTNGTAAYISLDQGLHATLGSSDAAPARQMSDGTDELAYFLYQNAGDTTVWGGVTGVEGNGQAQAGTGIAGTPLVVYGVVPAGQNVHTGSYADTVVATVSF